MSTIKLLDCPTSDHLVNYRKPIVFLFNLLHNRNGPKRIHTAKKINSTHNHCPAYTVAAVAYTEAA